MHNTLLTILMCNIGTMICEEYDLVLSHHAADNFLVPSKQHTYLCTSTLFLEDCSDILTLGHLALTTPFVYSGQGISGYRWDTYTVYLFKIVASFG